VEILWGLLAVGLAEQERPRETRDRAVPRRVLEDEQRLLELVANLPLRRPRLPRAGGAALSLCVAACHSTIIRPALAGATPARIRRVLPFDGRSRQRRGSGSARIVAQKGSKRYPTCR
jgi:hypothetical protein